MSGFADLGKRLALGGPAAWGAGRGAAAQEDAFDPKWKRQQLGCPIAWVSNQRADCSFGTCGSMKMGDHTPTARHPYSIRRHAVHVCVCVGGGL